MEGIQILEKALSDHTGALKAFLQKADERHNATNERLREIEQKLDRRPAGATDNGGQPGALTDLLMKSDGLAAFQKGTSRSVEITVPRQMFKAAILNATGSGQPLVQADRRPGIVHGPQRRFTIRDLFAALPTDSNMVEFTRELVFTNNAGPQYDPASPGSTVTEGAVKNESAMSFQLAQAPVATLAHWIPASRQVLSDAPALGNHVEQRLLYGLKLEEESEMLTGDGNAGRLSGLIPAATAFNRGSTNLTALDALAMGVAQLIASEYEPSGIIVNPADWYSNKLLLAKDSQGRYLFGNPLDMVEPRLWGLPVVVTNSMTAGNFMVLDAARTGYVADREEAIIRIAEQHQDFFTRNLVVILAEERLTLVIQLAAAMVYGSLSYAG